jgi:soluble lytic murein transglycosylase-like protein
MNLNRPYSKWTKEAAERYGIPPLLLARMLYKETGYNATAVNKTTGARGIAQLLPGALQSIKKDPNTFNYFDAKASIEAGAAYLAWNHNWYKDWAKSVAAYNWGIGNLDDWLSGLPMVLNRRKEWVPAPSIPGETKTAISHIFRGNPGAFDN